MTASLKLQKLESKISALRAQQDQLLQQQANDISKIILRLDLGRVEMSMLTGNLLEFREKINTKAPESEGWRQAGEKFLRVGKAKATRKALAHPHATPADQSSL